MKKTMLLGSILFGALFSVQAFADEPEFKQEEGIIVITNLPWRIEYFIDTRSGICTQWKKPSLATVPCESLKKGYPGLLKLWK
ncbi:hypothetical protein A9Q84_13855 [Halobacteriovorax marinus]|uniref:Secreted protein n=1 Tax=Halobacteriovorax marinus TaxID=97084 RepID=A0A1Y5F9F4_9BACT|nr:hypothetical protein A9Q84_13855 [Halobacteriovorax marinus]